MNLPEENFKFLPYVKKFVSNKGTTLIVYLISQSRENFDGLDGLIKNELARNNLNIIEIRNRRIVKTYAPGKEMVMYEIVIV